MQTVDGIFFRGQGAGMSNRLSMAQTQAIQALAATGKSHRAISKALGVDRGTVAKTVSQIQNQPPVWEAPTGPGDAPTGFSDGHQVAASDSETSVVSMAASSSSSSGNSDEPSDGSRSVCEPYRDQILRKLEQGLTVQRIWQCVCRRRLPTD